MRERTREVIDLSYERERERTRQVIDLSYERERERERENERGDRPQL